MITLTWANLDITVPESLVSDWDSILNGNCFGYTTNFTAYIGSDIAHHTMNLDEMLGLLGGDLQEERIEGSTEIYLNGVSTRLDDILMMCIYVSDEDATWQEDVTRVKYVEYVDTYLITDPRSCEYDGEYAYEQQQEAFNDFDL